MKSANMKGRCPLYFFNYALENLILQHSSANYQKEWQHSARLKIKGLINNVVDATLSPQKTLLNEE